MEMKALTGRLIRLTLFCGLLAAPLVSVADDDDAYYGMPGPGMMGGYHGYGMGMMGGRGPGSGMGYGMGMMGACGAGLPGMLDLSEEQRTKINRLQDEMDKAHWTIMGKMMEEQNRLRDLYQMDELDSKKIGAVYANISKLRQQMIEMHAQTTNQIQALLTKGQREQLRNWRRGGMGSPGMRGR